MRIRFTSFTVGLSLAFAFILAVCAAAWSQDVTVNYMPGTDFSQFKTYKWVPIESNMHPDPMVEQQIKQSIDNELASKGFVKTDDPNADLYVGYQVSIQEQKEWDAYNMGGGPRWGWGMGGMGMATVTSTTIQVGTLGFDVYDRANKKLIWRGSATKTLNPPKDPEKRQRNLDKAVAKLLKDFPPAPKK
ncbi:MAG TPA: DUF4136 domain-containing protein [Terriglobales bacterium]|nr:DUF4136 domain-containing protein [Terriglobales bacterium]